MQIIERDAWREQYFKDVSCPDDIVISTDDRDSFVLYPQHNWVYDKRNLCKTQKIRFGDRNSPPLTYPVFTKPYTNLRGMGIDSYAVNSERDFQKYCFRQNFWMEMLTGEHLSSDYALIDGKAVWVCHTEGIAAGEGTFDYWHISPQPRPLLEEYCTEWLVKHLSGYTGMVNIESIGGKMIEVHLRLIDQWPDLYGPGWIDAVVKLNAEKIWGLEARPQREAYSVVLFLEHGQNYIYPPMSLIDELKKGDSISSIQITFNPDAKLSEHAMPPGGFRVAIINCFDLDAGRSARARLAEFFLSGRDN